MNDQQVKSAPVETLKRKITAITGFVVFMLVLYNHEAYITRKATEITVHDMSTLKRSCRSLLPFKTYSINDMDLSRCRSLMSSKGPFRLVQSGIYLPGIDERQDIYDAFEVGCTYEIRFYGYGSVPKKGEPDSNVVPFVIYRRPELITCD